MTNKFHGYHNGIFQTLNPPQESGDEDYAQSQPRTLPSFAQIGLNLDNHEIRSPPRSLLDINDSHDDLNQSREEPTSIIHNSPGFGGPLPFTQQQENLDSNLQRGKGLEELHLEIGSDPQAFESPSFQQREQFHRIQGEGLGQFLEGDGNRDMRPRLNSAPLEIQLFSKKSHSEPFQHQRQIQSSPMPPQQKYETGLKQRSSPLNELFRRKRKLDEENLPSAAPPVQPITSPSERKGLASADLTRRLELLGSGKEKIIREDLTVNPSASATTSSGTQFLKSASLLPRNSLGLPTLPVKVLARSTKASKSISGSTSNPNKVPAPNPTLILSLVVKRKTPTGILPSREKKHRKVKQKAKVKVVEEKPVKDSANLNEEMRGGREVEREMRRAIFGNENFGTFNRPAASERSQRGDSHDVWKLESIPAKTNGHHFVCRCPECRD